MHAQVLREGQLVAASGDGAVHIVDFSNVAALARSDANPRAVSPCADVACTARPPRVRVCDRLAAVTARRGGCTSVAAGRGGQVVSVGEDGRVLLHVLGDAATLLSAPG